MSQDLDTLLAKLAATPRQRQPLHAFAGTRRFEIKRRLGGGSFGDVYEARDRESGALIALKALKSSQPEWVYRFKREFRSVRDLSHPNIVRVLELFCEEERWYLTMELVQGLPLDEHLERRPAELRACFTQLARALMALHAAGCLHRDVKPSNALVEATGRVVLLDFGLSLEHQEALHTAIAGTPPFMAPEIAGGARPSEASDWYAFGVMLYAALAGRLPYLGSHSEIFEQKLRHAPPAPSQLRSGVDAKLEALALGLLAPEPGDRPGGQAILAALGGAPASRPAGARAADPEVLLVGRERELEALERALAGVAAGTPGVVTLRGEAGMGKSALLAELASRCRSRGVQLFAGRCHETENVPYKGLDQAIDALCQELASRAEAEAAALVPGDADALAQMFPVLKRLPGFARARRDARAGTPQEARRRASRGLRELLVAMCTRAPLVLALDDLHWGNQDGLQLVAELVAAPAPPLLLVLAFRPQEPGAAPALERLLEAIAREPVARTAVEIGPLDHAGVAAFLAASPQTAVSPAQAMAETGGHPFLLGRLLAGPSLEHAPRVDLGARLAREIAALPPAALALLEVVSLAASPIGERAAFAVAELPHDAQVIDQLRRDRLVQKRAGAHQSELDVYHDRVREAVLAALSPPRRAALHLRLAELLERHGRVDAEALAHHFRHGGDRARALAWTRRAARAAAEALAFTRAVELLASALELTDDDRERLGLLEALAEAQVEVGRRSAAGDACLEAAAIAARLGDARASDGLRAGAGQHYLLGGHFERGFELVGALLAEVGLELPETPTLATAHALNLMLEIAARGLDFTRRDAADVDPARLRRLDLALDIAYALTLADVRGPWIAAAALRDALDAGEPVRVLRALAFFVLNQGAAAPGHQLVLEARSRARRLAAELGDEVGIGFTDLADATLSIHRWELITAIERCREAERRFLGLGGRHNREASVARVVAGLVCGMQSVDLPWAAAIAPDLLREALARDDLVAANWARMLLVWTELCADRPESALAHVEQTQLAWRGGDSLFASFRLVNKVMIELYRRPQAAWAEVERVAPEYEQLHSSVLPTSRMVWARALAAAALAARDAGLADDAATLARVRRAADLLDGVDGAEPFTHLVQALSHALAGDQAGYLRELEGSRAAWAGRAQRGAELATRYRICDASGDQAGLARAGAQLRELGVVSPERYASAYVGPLPRFR